LRIGGVGPVKSLLEVLGVLHSESGAGLVVPNGIAKAAIFIEGFIGDIPGEDPSAISPNDSPNVLCSSDDHPQAILD
jgi:hypothetical protein